MFWYLGDEAKSQRMEGFASEGIYRSKAAMGLTTQVLCSPKQNRLQAHLRALGSFLFGQVLAVFV